MVHHNQAEMTSGEQDEPGLEQVTSRSVNESSTSGPRRPPVRSCEPRQLRNKSMNGHSVGHFGEDE